MFKFRVGLGVLHTLVRQFFTKWSEIIQVSTSFELVDGSAGKFTACAVEYISEFSGVIGAPDSRLIVSIPDGRSPRYLCSFSVMTEHVFRIISGGSREPRYRIKKAGH